MGALKKAYCNAVYACNKNIQTLTAFCDEGIPILYKKKLNTGIRLHQAYTGPK